MRIFAGGVVVALGFTLAGCATSSSSTPPTPPAPKLAVSAPQNGATMNSEPVTISVTASNISDPSQLSIVLDGVDVTSQFSKPDANGVLTAQVSQPSVNYGNNQVQVRYDTVRANSSFILNRPAQSTPPVGQNGVDQSSQMVGITTRVLAPGTTGTKATDWGIQVTSSSSPYWSPTPHDQNDNPCGNCSSGFQIVVLRRGDLSLVWNKSFETANASELAPHTLFLNTLASLGYGPFDSVGPVTMPPILDCVPTGCIMIMQSLAQIGYTPCYSSTIGTCDWASDSNFNNFNLAYWLTKVGASGNVLYANGGNPHVGYSFIGNVGSLPGNGINSGRNNGSVYIANGGNQNSQFERLGCLDTRYQNSANVCDSAGREGSADNAGGSTDLQQAGRIDGVFIRDNFNLFTFSQSVRDIAYTFGTTIDSTGNYVNVVSIDGSTTEGAGQYTMAMPSGAKGGFRLLILNRTHPDWADAKQFDRFYRCCDATANDLQSLINDLQNYPDANGLVFLASMGFIQHDNNQETQSDPQYGFTTLWDNFVHNALQVVGGDPMTGKILGDRYIWFDYDGLDDYLLVGKVTANAPPFADTDNFTAGTSARYTAQESGYVINRHTVAGATSPTKVEGVLVPDHEGYYTPHMQGFQHGVMVPQVTTLASASLLPPLAWPFSAGDTAATAGERTAYSYISNLICCTDIRQTYLNLNASPTAWMGQLEQLSYNTIVANDPSFGKNVTSDEYEQVTSQLTKEFGYVADARNLNTNILSLYQSEQSNVGLILTQANDDILSQLDLSSTPPPSGPTAWSILTSDVFPMISTLAELAGPEGDIGTNYTIAGVDNAVGIGTLIIDNATDHSNNSGGASQLMQSLSNENLAAANLAQHEADQYVDSVATLANDFKRVVSNWNSLKAIGGPIDNGQLVWDPSATSVFLRAFDLTTRRKFFPLLMNNSGNYWVTHILYVDDHYYASDGDFVWGHNEKCETPDFSNSQFYSYTNGYEGFKGTAWWPGVLQSSSGSGNYPTQYWRDIWVLGGSNTDERCPNPNVLGSLPSTFGMFDPISMDSNFNTNGLGLWKPYVFQYTFSNKLNSNNWFSNVP